MLEYLHSLAKDERNGVVASLVKSILMVLSFAYIILSAAIKALYRSGILKTARLNCRVISVGNITLGGTGKTPFTAFLAKYLTQKGKKVAILIRGYKRRSRAAEYGIRNTDTMGDEGYLLARDSAVPVLVGRNRIATAKEAIAKYNADTIILDDGFQHWRLHRDLDIVLINALNPFGNLRVIPRGILREPLFCLKRADVFLLTKADLAKNPEEIENKLGLINPRALIVRAIHLPLHFYDLEGNKFELSYVKDKEVCIFSAIADPLSLEKMILNLGAKIKQKAAFPDHYRWQKDDLDRLSLECEKRAVNVFITTAKDSVKLEGGYFNKGIKVLVLHIGIKIISNEQEFYLRLFGG